MAKNIVLCSDGTGNTPGKGRGTNIWKLYLAVDRHDHESNPSRSRQIAFYDDGVGTEGIRLFRILGGAFGFGLSRNIRQLYASLVLNYKRNDKVFLFGFSRGAFTVRSLAGMICRCGLLKRDDYLGKSIKERNKLLKRILRAYRSEDKNAGKSIQKELDLQPIEIEFIGVWDTVDAVGMPFDELKVLDCIWRKLFSVRLWGFHDQVLSSKVTRGCQALAIDDERRTFHPNVWKPREGVEQVWFAGVHSNVGGGYPKEGLANVALYWMMLQAQAKESGLRFVKDAVDKAHDEANAHGKLYDSRLGLAAYYRYKPRNIEALCGNGNIKVHVTALDRIRWATDGYAPTNLPAKFDVVDPDASKKGKEGVKQRVDEQQARVDDSASQRAAKRGRANALSRGRVLLYYAFLLFSGALVLTLARSFWELERLTQLLVTVSNSLRPILGWANPMIIYIIEHVQTVLSVTVGVAIPGFLVSPIGSLKSIPEVTTIFVLLGILLFWIRKILVRKMREHGERMWQSAFNDGGPVSRQVGTASGPPA